MVAKESADTGKASQDSLDAYEATKPADEEAKKALDEFKNKFPDPDATPDQIAAQDEIPNKSDTAKTANEAYEKANTEYAAKNAAASDAYATALKTGSDADFQRAKELSAEAQAAGTDVQNAGKEAKTTGEDVQKAVTDDKSKYPDKPKSDTHTDPQDNKTTVDTDVHV